MTESFATKVHFPKSVEIWNRRGEVVKQVADLAVADTVPNAGVRRFLHTHH